MAFNPIDQLASGNAYFIFNLTEYDRKTLIEDIRKSPKRNIIIKKNARFLMKLYRGFLLYICYDVEEFKNLTQKIITPKFLNNSSKVFNLMNNTSWGTDYIINNIDEIYKNNEDIINTIISTLFMNYENNKKYIKQLSIHKNLHIRYIFMRNLLLYNQDKLPEIYDDITKYLTSYTYQEYEQITFFPEKMNIKDISDLANITFNTNSHLWPLFKNYILSNYKTNDIAENLSTSKEGKKELEKDLETLFETSRRYKIHLIKQYKNKLSKQLLEEYLKYLNMFKKNNNYDSAIEKIFTYELYEKLKEYTDKYLSLSKTQDVYHLGEGTTCSAYRIGDFTLKLVKTKWSYEDIICPNLYLIAKNLEEDYIRDQEGIVKAGLEVQKYLSKSAKNVPYQTIQEFRKELTRMGYKLNDSMINGQCGDNCLLLDDYHDADTRYPENLPEWFKETPLVLVDRDRVYRIEQDYIKQQKSGY